MFRLQKLFVVAKVFFLSFLPIDFFLVQFIPILKRMKGDIYK